MSTKPSYLKETKPVMEATIFGFLVLAAAFTVWGNETLFLWINRQITPFFGIPAIGFSALGESLPMVILIVAAFFISLRRAFGIGFSWLLGSCFSWLFKLWLAKDALRPQKFFRNQGFEINTVSGVEVHHYHSFPSGHTITAFTILWMLPFLFPQLKRHWTLFYVFLAFGCGLSRMILGQHWPQDILGGMFFGSLAGFFSGLLFSSFQGPGWLDNRIPNRFFAK